MGEKFVKSKTPPKSANLIFSVSRKNHLQTAQQKRFVKSLPTSLTQSKQVTQYHEYRPQGTQIDSDLIRNKIKMKKLYFTLNADKRKIVGSNPDWGTQFFFFSFFAEIFIWTPPSGYLYPINVVNCFCTQKLGLETVIFESQLLSTTEMVNLSWKFHLALVLTIPGS